MDTDRILNGVALEKLLLPALSEFYRREMVLDNAPCHHGMLGLRKNSSPGDQGDILITLRTLGEDGAELDREAGQEVDGIVALRLNGLFFSRAPEGGNGISLVRRVLARGRRSYRPPRTRLSETRVRILSRRGQIPTLERRRSASCCTPRRRIAPTAHCKNDVSTNSLGGGSLRVVHKALRRDAWHGRSKRKDAADCFELVNSSSRMISLKGRSLSRTSRAARLEGLCCR